MAVISISFAAFFPTQAKQTAQTAAITVESASDVAIQNTLTELDSDKDGLKDWEESLWATDSKNKDTDGDGTSDGKEITLNRNPVVKGPKDSLETEKVAATQQASSTPVSATDKISRQLFTQYMAIKQSGGEITPEVEQQLIESIIAQNNFGSLASKIYVPENLKTISDSPEAIKDYGNALGKIILDNAFTQKDSKGMPVNELTIIDQAMQRNNKAELDRINKITESYENIIARMLALEVPQSVALIHLDIINYFGLAIKADKDLQQLFVDTATAFGGITAYKAASFGLSNSLTTLRQYFIEAQVAYNRSEPGYTMTN